MVPRFLLYRPRSVQSCFSRSPGFVLRAVLFSLFAFTSSTALSVAHDEAAAPPEPTVTSDNERQTLEELTHTLFSSLPGGSGSQGAGVFHSQTQVMSDPASIAAARQQLLATLIETHPEEILRMAIPQDLRASLSSEIQPYVENEVTLEGNLTIFCEEGKEKSCLRYSLDTGDGQLSLHFANQPSAYLQTDSPVRVHGVQVGQAVALESEGMNLMTLAA